MTCRGTHITRLLLITLLVLSHGPVYAEWVAVEKNDQLSALQTVYIDPASIRREGNLVMLWQLTDFVWMQGGPRATPRFLSTTSHKQFDCAERRLRLLAYTEFSHRMGIGIADDGYVDNDYWFLVEPESMNQVLWEVACNTQ